jgi:hypothetical protein
MSPRVLFVHGTGVREPAYSNSYARVRTRFSAISASADVAPCYWGELCGARFNAEGRSIPEFDTTRALIDEPEAEDLELTLWELLYRDPLFECRVLATAAKPGSSFGRGNAALLEKMSTGLDAPGAERINSSMRWVCAQPEFITCVESAEDERDLAQPAARASVARAIQQDEESGSAEYDLANDATQRDILVEEIARYLAGLGESRGFIGGLVGFATAPITGFALRSASWLGRRRRGRVMEGVSPVAGDILLYQARGKPMRDLIRSRIRETGATVVVAHSLGGVACVDLLIEASEPSVSLLVTVGSQAPYFYEIDALQTLSFDHTKPPEQRLPQRFPQWLNVYDRRDFLSFIGEEIFGSRVKDVQVNNRQPFPQSHSAYWNNDAVWDAIRQALPKN